MEIYEKQNDKIDTSKKAKTEMNDSKKNTAKRFWKTESDKGYYTVYYCPKCERQRTIHTTTYPYWECDHCHQRMIYDFESDELKTIKI